MLYKIALSLIPGIGNVLAKNLIAYTGSVEAVFKEKKQNLTKIPGIGESLAKSISKAEVFHRAEKELKFIDRYKIKPYFYLDENYPYRLKEAGDAPIVLYTKGNIEFNTKKIISIVGTRKITNYGISNCERLIQELVERNHQAVIISGLAYGVDICAHKAALKNNLPTAGVLAHGLDTIYPAMHKNTAKQMLENGGLISEFTSETKMIPQNFVKRNRIIAALSDATIVIESAAKGGSLLTADMANSYNRDVFALPGKINDKYSEGCNRLIKSNRAVLLENVKDLEYILGWEEKKGQQIKQKMLEFLTTEEQTIYNFLKTSGLTFIDEISHKTQIPIQKTSSLLLNMEFSGIIRSLPGKMYEAN